MADEFGINVWVPPQGMVASMAAFYQGRAWESLKVWVRQHPALAKRINKLPYSHNYLPRWYERALGLLPIVEYQPCPYDAIAVRPSPSEPTDLPPRPGRS